jgi:hypothetical protein
MRISQNLLLCQMLWYIAVIKGADNERDDLRYFVLPSLTVDVCISEFLFRP